MARGAIIDATVNASRTAFLWPGPQTTGDSVNGHYFVWGPRKVLTVRNTTGGALNVTFTPDSTRLDVFVAPTKIISVPPGQRMFGPFPSYYAHPDDNDRVYVDVSGAVFLGVYDMAGI